MSSDLGEKAKKGLFWNSIDRFSNQGINFVFSILLARVLSPKDYGMIAMLYIFTEIAQSFVDSGFSSALIRKPNRSEEDNSTAFYFNIIVGFFSYAVLFLIAPFVADFYNLPILNSILRVVGLSVIFNSFCVVQQSLLTSRLDFKLQAKISLSCTILSGLIGLWLAYNGYGVWALVFLATFGPLMRMTLLWGTAKWKPKASFSNDSFHYLFGYGSKILASGLLNTLYNNVYPIVIGKFFSPASLGLVSRAQSFANMPINNITGVLRNVTFPLLSQIQDDDNRLRENYRKMLRMSAFVIFPLVSIVAAIAFPLVRFLLTEKWTDCVGYLRIVCLAQMWFPIHVINLNLLQVKGRSDLFLRLEIIKKIIGVMILVVTIPLGITAMCWGMVVSSLFSLVVNTFYTGKLINMGFIKQMFDLLPFLFLSFIIGLLIYYISSFLTNDFICIVVGVLLGLSLYFSFSFLANFPELQELYKFFHKK